MPRKAFVADVEAAAELNFPGICDVSRGDDDGEVNVSFMPSSGALIEISMCAQPGMPFQ